MDAMKKALPLAALLPPPALVGLLLLGTEFTGITVIVARVAGIALVALGVACWPGPPIAGMLMYSTVVMLYLAYLGLTGAATGVALWPAVGVHAIITALLARIAWSRQGSKS
jgi:hypothetical protein